MAADPVDEGAILALSVEAAIRIAVVAGLTFWCFEILRPFLQPILWSIVISVAVHPLFRRLERRLGGRPRTAGAIVSVAALIVLIVPMALLTGSLMDTAVHLSEDLKGGKLVVPPPPARVADVPLVGQSLYASWTLASQNIESVLQQFGPQLRTAAQWIVSTAAATGMGIVKFVISLILAGVLLAASARGRRAADAVSTRLIGGRGVDLTNLAVATIQSVTRGILLVALTQSLLTGLGCLAVGLPAAGLWAVVKFVNDIL